MKKILINITCILFSSFCLTACPSDRDDEEGYEKTNTSKEILSNNIKQFVGYWDIYDANRRRGSIFFFQDNKCRYELDNTVLVYSWSYDSKTKFLSITGRSDMQLQIMSIDDNSWSALDMANESRGVSAKRIEMKGDPDKWLSYFISYEKKWKANDTLWASFEKTTIIGHYLLTNISYVLEKDGTIGKYASKGLFYESKEGWTTREKEYDNENDIARISIIDWSGSYTSKKRSEKIRLIIEFYNMFSYKDLFMKLTLIQNGKTLSNEKYYPNPPRN